MDVVLQILLLAGEAEVCFATAQPFTVWADAIISDEATRGAGLLGEGVILGQEPAASPTGSDRGAHESTGRRPVPSCDAIPPPRLGLRTSAVGGRQ
jgi:hypothetical protein